MNWKSNPFKKIRFLIILPNILCKIRSYSLGGDIEHSNYLKVELKKFKKELLKL